jgi:hypothetical protein
VVPAPNGHIVRVATTFLRLHGFDLFIGVAVAAGLLGFGLVQVHLPQAAEQSYGDYTRLTAFHTLPMLLAPIVGFVLVGASPQLERQASRRMQATRCGLMLGCTVIALGALLPASLVIDLNDAVQVTAENTLFVIGAGAVLTGWFDRAWSWFPVVAIGTAGLISADYSTLSTIAVIDRTAGDTTACLVAWLVGLAHYTVKGGHKPTRETPFD